MTTNFRQSASKFTMVLGMLTAALGVAMVFVPHVVQIGGEGIMVALLFSNAVLMVAGIFMAQRLDVRAYEFLLAAVSLAAGAIILVHPLDTNLTLATLLGFYFMIEGALISGLATHLRAYKEISGILWVIGGVSLVMSLLIWIRLAGAPRTVLFAMLGLAFVARGFGYAALGRWAIRNPPLRPDQPQVRIQPKPAGG